MLGLASPALAAVPTHRLAAEASPSSAADTCDWHSYDVGSISAVRSGGGKCNENENTNSNTNANENTATATASGEPGPTAPGADAVLTTFQVEGPVVVAEGGGGTATSTATCPAGSVVTGGGFVIAVEPGNDVAYQLIETQRGPGNSWQVTIQGEDDTPFFAVAECATLS